MPEPTKNPAEILSGIEKTVRHPKVGTENTDETLFS